MSHEIETIEESDKDKYIETHFAVLRENLDIIQSHLKSVMKNTRFIQKVIDSKVK